MAIMKAFMVPHSFRLLGYVAIDQNEFTRQALPSILNVNCIPETINS